jgi:predicted dehydrogenase
MSQVRFSVIGINHGHIYAQVDIMLKAGAELVSFYAPEEDLALEFKKAFPHVPMARSGQEILEDPRIQLIVSAAIPCERAPLGIAAMQHGKDYMTDKPGFTSLEQLAEARQVQAQTGRIYSICYGERLLSPAAVRTGELVSAGVIGQVIQTLGIGPHRISLSKRPDWFYQREKYGGILCDIGSHQVDQFLYYTGSTSGEVVSSQVANFNHPEYPELEDFGDMLLRSPTASGYIRVDWFTPDGLPTWGDGRLFLLGTDGYIELRKYVDVAGRPGGDHLFLVNHKGMQYIDCSAVGLQYGKQLSEDIVARSETAMTQAHCFLASELTLKAQAAATRIIG